MISIYDYTAKDIYTLFSNLYKEKHGISYKGAGFIGNEMHLIKVAIEENGSANIPKQLMYLFLLLVLDII